MADDRLMAAAGQIADGAEVDWLSISSSLSTDEDREIADELAVVARIARGHRELHDLLPPTPDTPHQLMPDRTRWAHLDLLNIVGRGSYGTVYRAWDTRLERLVALKLFHGAHDPDHVMREGRMLARMRHENVVTVYGADIIDGVAGIWMELVHGETLDQIVRTSGPMKVPQAASIGADVARALNAVHTAGLLHCDIKAQNVVRESTGRVVLMDLGAGRPMPEAVDDTRLSDVAGTPRYMAPELFHAGAHATRATDIYSFGVLLYYLASANYPVEGKSLGELKQAHIDRKVRPLDQAREGLPPAYVALVARAIDPDATKRPESAAEIQSSLTELASPPATPSLPRSIGMLAAVIVAVGLLVVIVRPMFTPAAPPAPEIRSIAVLPIKNLTGDESKAYIADGLTEVLISNLARVHALRVPSFAAVAPFRNTSELDPRLSKLGVQLLLAGSVTRADTKIHVVVRLVDVTTNTVQWGEDIESDLSGALAAQGQLARMVANRLALTLSADEDRSLTPRQIKPDAQEAYLRGLALDSAGPSRSSDAGQFFRQAVEMDPSFAAAWSQLAMNESRMIQQSSADRRPRAKLAHELAEKAIQLDPSDGTGYAALGSIEFYHEWQFDKAEQSFRRALAIQPSHAFARQRLAMLLAARGQLNEAITLAREAQVLEPMDPRRLTSLGGIYMYARDYATARRETERAMSLSPNFPVAHFGLGLIDAAEGHYAAAAAHMEQSLNPGRPQAYLVNLARVYAAAGDVTKKDEALKEVFARAKTGDEYSIDNLAYIAAAEGRLDEAFRILDDSVDQHLTDVLWIMVDPRADPLRNDPRFDRLVSRIGIRP